MGSGERGLLPPALAIRLPIIPTLLRQIYSFCHLSGHSYDMSLLWAATVTCFFGFFHAGEITVPTALAFDPAMYLAWGDVSVSDDNSMIRVFLKRSKTDQFGHGVAVYLGATGDDLCPLAALSSHIPLRGDSPGAFLRTVDGAALTKARFVDLVRGVLSRAGVPLASYSGHSFRIGAATTASQAGIPDSVIQALGRWSNSAFLQYIRTPRGQLAQYIQSLSRIGI